MKLSLLSRLLGVCLYLTSSIRSSLGFEDPPNRSKLITDDRAHAYVGNRADADAQTRPKYLKMAHPPTSPTTWFFALASS
jgi:hypothetical protein